MPAKAMSKFFRRLARPRAAALGYLLSGALAPVVPVTSAGAAQATAMTTTLTPETARLVVDVAGVQPVVPVFFSAQVEQTLRFTRREVAGEWRVRLRVLQGRPETVALGLDGDGDVVNATGPGLRSWAVRQGADGERRLLELALAPARGDGRAETGWFEFVVVTRQRVAAVPGSLRLLVATPGEATTLAGRITLVPGAAVDVRETAARGLTPVAAEPGLRGARVYLSHGDNRLDVRLEPRAAAPAELELVAPVLAGRAAEAEGTVRFALRAQARAQRAGARVRLLEGRAALAGATAGDGWHVELAPAEGDARAGYDLVADRAGGFAVELEVAAGVATDGDWRGVDFAMPAGVVVPLHLDGWADGVSFADHGRVVPVRTADGWRGFLPADGAAAWAWKHARTETEAALAFTSQELTEVRVGAGLLQQTAQLVFKVLQGRLTELKLRLEGPGDITGVDGAHVTGWRVEPGADGATRVLAVTLSRPMASGGALTIRSQAELGAWPVRAEPLRVTPEGGVRHAGTVRVANRGAVRLEVAEAGGMMQLGPEQWPGAPAEAGVRQALVYRFPAATRSYRVLAAPIQAEVGVAMIATAELAESGRGLTADVELDVREAPLREWAVRVPADFAVVAVTGTDVADTVTETEVTDGRRTVRVLFARAIEGRQLLHLRLEKNQPAAAGAWVLPVLQFPGAKTVRGHLGAVAAPGYRLVAGRTERLAEVPVSFFPKQTAGLQQAWRLREPEPTAEVTIEALAQSVQADVFHLHALKEGTATASVLVNYHVVGAPVSEWRLAVPAGAGNLDITGQHVRRDWRREGDEVIVPLHQPVLGGATLLLTYEEPMSARGGLVTPGAARPVGVQTERGYVQVVSARQVRHAVRRAEGALLGLEPRELPAEYRVFSSAPPLATYHYTARPFALELDVDWYAAGDLVEQTVDFARLASQVARDGQVVTEARYFVKTRGRGALRVVLPPGVKLWETRVDQEPVQARADGASTVVPLPVRANPNDPVTVTLRLGQAGEGDGRPVRLAAPRVESATTVAGEWVVRGEPGRQLRLRGDGVRPLETTGREPGFAWIERRHLPATWLVLALAGFGALIATAGGWRSVAGMWLATAGALGAWLLAGEGMAGGAGAAPAALTFATALQPAGAALTLDLEQVATGAPAWAPGGAVLAAAGLVLLVLGWRIQAGGAGGGRRAGAAGAMIAGPTALAAGVLVQPGGAPVFFFGFGAGVLAVVLLPAVVRWRRERRERRERRDEAVTPGSAAGEAGVVSGGWWVAGLGAALLAGLGAGGEAQAQVAVPSGVARGGAATVSAPVVPVAAGGEADAAPAWPEGLKASQAVVQRWTIRGGRLHGEAEVTVRGVAGESFALLRGAVTLTEFRGDGLRAAKTAGGDGTVYVAVLERDGTATARVRFERAVPDRGAELAVPTGPAVVQQVTVELDEDGWAFASAQAVAVTPAAPAPGRSGATLVLAPHGPATVRAVPRRRDAAAETTRFFAEGAQLFAPGPGVVNGTLRLAVRPVQGRVTELVLAVPTGFTVGDVGRGPVGAWRFDPAARRLHVAVEPAQTEAFALTVETQLGAEELPYALAVEPLRVVGAASDTGLLALAFGTEAQPEAVRASGLAATSAQDFDATLLPRGRDGRATATLPHAWRYGPEGGRAELSVAPVTPEVRVAVRQVLTLDDDRLVLAADLRAAITRTGVFKLSFALPDGLDVETASGAALSQWTEARDGAQRIVTLHLRGRTLGEQSFAVTLAGAAPRAQEAWPLPRLTVREATRQTGEVVVVPGQGLRLRATAREGATPVDPRGLGGMQPGTLAFRLLQDDWTVALGIEALEPWVTVQALQETTLREGQTLTRLALRHRIENAAVKTLRVRLPGLGEDSARTVRATGAAVSEIVRVPAGTAGRADEWELRFQRGVAGDVDTQIEFQGAAERTGGRELLVPPEFPSTRQATVLVAVRTGGRLEAQAPAAPRGWTRHEWSAVPAALLHRTDRSVPALCFRVAEPEGPLAVEVRRHDVAEALALRVTEGRLTTLVAESGAVLTAAELTFEVLERSPLRVRLPEGTRLFNVTVNGENAAAVRDGGAWRFHVAPGSATGRTAKVRFAFAPPGAGGTADLRAPGLSVPLENVTWRVALPPGHEVVDRRGTLQLDEVRTGGGFGVEHYVTQANSRRTAEAKEAMALLQQAGTWLQRGEQDKAAETLNRVSNSFALDAAANEDARVQLRNVKTQQAIAGLTTRRQRLYLDQAGGTGRNAQLEQAARSNPLLNGAAAPTPQSAEQQLLGHTPEEHHALKGIAARIVEQQLTAEAPAGGAIDVTLPERGRVLTFSRRLQVDGAAPLELRLTLRPSGGASATITALLLAGMAAVAWIATERRGMGVR